LARGTEFASGRKGRKGCPISKPEKRGEGKEKVAACIRKTKRDFEQSSYSNVTRERPRMKKRG